MAECKRRALISVSDKTGVVDLARQLVKRGWEVISTGGTARTLQGAGVAVKEVQQITGFPEILEGRVKTLHPRIHGAILARFDRDDHRRQMKEHGICPLELVVVNLYPFVQTIARKGVTLEEAVESIDIGGPAMIRAAAKNFAHVTVVVEPVQYPLIIEELDRSGSVAAATRFELARRAFAHTARYDAVISGYFLQQAEPAGDNFHPTMNLELTKIQDLRYGENPQQKACFYAETGHPFGLASMRQLQGKELSFNNLNDLNAAWELVQEFEQTAVVALKHTNPCGVGVADTMGEAYARAYAADPVSIFGGIVAANRPVDGATAGEMVKIFLEAVAAPGFDEEALEIFKQKKNIRLLELDPEQSRREKFDLKKVAGGMLLQTIDRQPVKLEEGTAVTERQPTAGELEDLTFAIKVVKHVKSNAIVVAAGSQTLGVGAGQMNRVGAARIALEQAGEKARGAVLGSDAFFPFPDTVEEAAKAGITAIAQPGGSIRDQESIDVCNRHGMAMVFTGRRYFKH